jgi:hypothetical protein
MCFISFSKVANTWSILSFVISSKDSRSNAYMFSSLYLNIMALDEDISAYGLYNNIVWLKVSCCRMSMQFLTIIVLPQLMSDSSTIVDCFLASTNFRRITQSFLENLYISTRGYWAYRAYHWQYLFRRSYEIHFELLFQTLSRNTAFRLKNRSQNIWTVAMVDVFVVGNSFIL